MIRLSTLAVFAFVSTIVAGCAGIPKIGEGEEVYLTSFPGHPVTMALHAGGITAKSLPEGVRFDYEHWMGIKGGSHIVDAGQTDRGYNAWGSLLGCYSNVRWNQGGTHLMETTSYTHDLEEVTKREFFKLLPVENGWEKEPLTEAEFQRVNSE